MTGRRRHRRVVDCGTRAELFERQQLFRDRLRESETEESPAAMKAG